MIFDRLISKLGCYFSGHRPNVDLEKYKKKQTGFITHVSIKCLDCKENVFYQIEVVRNDRGNFIKMDEA